MASPKSTILFTGGGTAGHLSPLLVIAKALHAKAPELSLHLAVPKSNLSSPLLQDLDYLTLHPVESGKINRYLTLKHFGEAGRLVKGIIQAEQLLHELKPKLVFAKGGYGSIPVVLAAARRQIPIFGHETDSVPGLANRVVLKFAQSVFTGFPIESYASLPQAKLIYSGQPVRPEFYARDLDISKGILSEINWGEPVITVVGGSQGGHALNNLVEAIWPHVLAKAQLVQICGPHDLANLEAKKRTLPEELQKRLILASFLKDELAVLFQKSTIVISRSGGTIFELAASGSALILVPLSTSAQNHQCINAQIFQKSGAALVLDEVTGKPEELLALVKELLDHPEERQQLQKAISQFSHPDAVEVIVSTLHNMVD